MRPRTDVVAHVVVLCTWFERLVDDVAVVAEQFFAVDTLWIALVIETGDLLLYTVAFEQLGALVSPLPDQGL